MDREQKVWGERWILRRTTSLETSLLLVRAGYRCSWHVHAHKWNLFTVIEGCIGIKTEEGETMLHAGEEFTVEPGVYHEFRAYAETRMVEIMYVEYQEGDIHRGTVGGRFESERSCDAVEKVPEHRIQDNDDDASKAATVVPVAKEPPSHRTLIPQGEQEA